MTLLFCASVEQVSEKSGLWSQTSLPHKTSPSYSAKIDPYLPDPGMPYKTPLRYIKVNVHFTNSKDRSQNLTGRQAQEFAEELIEKANRSLLDNQPMNLPAGNHTPVRDINYQYIFWPNVRDAIIHDYDNDLYYTTRGKNQYNRDIISSYSRSNEEVLNIFIMPHHPDSIASPTYGALNTGIALGNNIKLNGDFLQQPETWRYVNTLNHEVGHVLGLVHSWGSDPCDDTPKHPNCWEPKSSGPCEGPTSNNMMDYNNKQNALTPCQLSIVNRNFNRPDSRQRKLLLKNWCEKREGVIRISDDSTWDADMDIMQDVVIEAGGRLTISSSIHLAEDVRITVESGASLRLMSSAHLYNDCGKSWSGIFMEKKGEVDLERDPEARIENVSK